MAWLRQLFLGRPRTRERHLDALDGLRGLAVLVVIGSHLSNAGILPRPGLSGIGKCGVYLFFVLSAYLLTRLQLQRPLPALADGRHWADYALRRVLRIWPLYLFVLLLSWFLTRQGMAGWHYQMDDAALLGHVLLREGQSVLWSIPVEFTFYLWLPLLVVVMAWTAVRWPLWAQALLGLALVAAALLAWPPGESRENDVRLGPYLVIFLCGAYAARVDVELERRGLGAAWTRGWGVVGLVGLGACLAMAPVVWAWLWSRPFDSAVSHRWFLAYGVAWSLLLLGILHGPAWLRRPFSWAPMRWVGVVSFSAYLWHMPVLDAVRALGSEGWPAAGLVLGLTLAVAAISFLVFERPWREIRLSKPRP